MMAKRIFYKGGIFAAVFIFFVGAILYRISPARSEIQEGPSETNVIQFEIPTDLNNLGPSCAAARHSMFPWIAWQEEEKNILEQAAAEGWPILRNLFGPPFADYTGDRKICLGHNPDWRATGEFVPSLNLLILRHPSAKEPNPSNTIEKAAFWHEFSHIFYSGPATNFLYHYPQWAEPLAQLGAHLVSKQTGYTDWYLPFESEDYEQYNKPYYDSLSMRVSKIDWDTYTARYTTAPTVWLKLHREYPNLVKDFSARLYGLYKDGGNPYALGYKLDREFLAIVDSLISSSSHYTVEGEPFLNWYGKQYPIKQTKGDYKFGSRIIADFERVKLRFNYYQSPQSNDEHKNDIKRNGVVSYEIKNSAGAKVLEQSGVALNGFVDLDITGSIRDFYGGNMPQGKMCVAAHLSDTANNIETDNSSCYYLRGSLSQKNHLGIVGTIGGPDDINLDGAVTITPLAGQSVSAATIPLNNGGFTGPSYFSQAGLYRLNYQSADNAKKGQKYITKDANSYYYTNIPLIKDYPSPYPAPKSLSSDQISSGASTIHLQTPVQTAAIYFINQSGKPPYLYDKNWDAKFSYNESVNNLGLAPSDTYNLLLADSQGLSANGQNILFGAAEEIYISKWPDKYEVKKGEIVEFKIKVSKISEAASQVSYQLTDSLGGFVNQPFEINYGGAYSNGVIAWPSRALNSRLPSITHSFKIGL